LELLHIAISPLGKRLMRFPGVSNRNLILYV